MKLQVTGEVQAHTDSNPIHLTNSFSFWECMVDRLPRLCRGHNDFAVSQLSGVLTAHLNPAFGKLHPVKWIISQRINSSLHSIRHRRRDGTDA